MPVSKSTSVGTCINIGEIHEQLVQPITFLKAAIDLWLIGLHEPEDIIRMEDQIQKLVDVVRGLQEQLKI